MPFPYIFTFYSYKGGVGRSMALMNVAYRLAGWGRHVLIVDMDLEAPGLSRSSEFEPAAPDSKDIVDFLAKGLRLLSSGAASEELISQLPRLESLVRTVIPDMLAPLTPKMGQLGRLDLLGCDLDRQYLDRLAHLSLKDCAPEEIAALSHLLHGYFKSQRISHRPFWMESFEPEQEVPYDFVLVDSRTGISEIGGLCVGPLSDRLVVLTGLNDQNIAGTLEVLKEVGIHPEQRSSSSEPWDDADSPRTFSSSLGPKPTILAASPVPNQEISLRERRFAVLEDKLGISPLLLSYHALLALEEGIFVRDHPEEPLGRDYITLAKGLLALVSDDQTSLLREVARYVREETDQTRDLSVALKSLTRVAPCDSTLAFGAIWSLVGRSAPTSNETAPSTRQVYALLSQEQDRDTRAYALHNWAIRLMIIAKNKTGSEADDYFRAAYQKYSDANQTKPDDYLCFYNWGSALVTQGRRKSGDEACQLLEAAEAILKKSHELKPDFAEALDAWGKSLLFRGLTQEAVNRSLDAERLKRGSGSMNLAYAAAAEGSKATMLEWLYKATPAPSRASLSELTVFDTFRSDTDFVAFLSSLREN